MAENYVINSGKYNFFEDSKLPMSELPNKLLYFLEERIPPTLRSLVEEHISRNGFEFQKVTYAAPDAEKIEKLQWADAVLFAPGRYLSDEIFSHCPHIRLMQLWSSGYDKFNIKSALKYNIPVANNGGGNASSVAEHAVLLMLSVYKWLPHSHHRTITGNWAGTSHGMDMFMLEHKTVGIIGFGNIGRHVAQKLKGFNVKLFYFDIKRADQAVEEEYQVTYLPLHELLIQSDIITLHVHHNEATRNMIGEKEFAIMKSNAILINVSRAQIVEPHAFFNALKSGRIHGAGLDVYMEEPTTTDDPLMQLQNIVATPHMAGCTFDTYQLALSRCMENLHRAMQGEPLQWLVV